MTDRARPPAWCSLYTLAVPADVRARRREELASHVHDARASWGASRGTTLRLALASVRGALDDLLWCDDVRRLRGMPSLAVGMVLGPVGGLAVAGSLIGVAFVSAQLEMIDVFGHVREVTSRASAAVLVASVAHRSWRRWRTQGSA